MINMKNKKTKLIKNPQIFSYDIQVECVSIDINHSGDSGQFVGK